MTHDDPAARDGSGDVWDDAPCGLVELDRSSRIVRVNARFLELTGRGTAAGLPLAQLLAPGARILFHTQLAPMLALNGAIDELLIEVLHVDGTRVPCLLSARARPEDSARVVAALIPVPDRDRYERTLRDARLAAESANRRERTVSLALQQALLTALPPPGDRWEIVAHHMPGDHSHEIGGDWYDAFSQPDGTPVAVIGDVVGHDIAAAAAMGQLRGVLRTVAYTQAGSPAQVLTTTDRAAHGLGVDVLATAVVARFLDEPGAEQHATLEWSNAGHPPPLLVRSTGAVDVLARASDLLLGVRPDCPRHDHRVTMSAGDTLLLYTDGLIERPGEVLDDGIARLAAAVGPAAPSSLGELCRAALEHRADRTGDDVAAIAVRLRAHQA